MVMSFEKLYRFLISVLNELRQFKQIQQIVYGYLKYAVIGILENRIQVRQYLNHQYETYN